MKLLCCGGRQRAAQSYIYLNWIHSGMFRATRTDITVTAGDTKPLAKQGSAVVPLFSFFLSFVFVFDDFFGKHLDWRRFSHSHNNLAIFGRTEKKTNNVNQFHCEIYFFIFGIDRRNLNFICASTPLPHHGALIKSRLGEKSTFRPALACCRGSGCCDRGHSSCPFVLHSHVRIIYHSSIGFLSLQSILFLVAASESGRSHVWKSVCRWVIAGRKCISTVGLQANCNRPTSFKREESLVVVVVVIIRELRKEKRLENKIGWARTADACLACKVACLSIYRHH